MTQGDRRESKLPLVLVGFVVFSTLLSGVNAGINVVNLKRLDRQSDHSVRLIRVTQASRLKSAEAFCAETEAIKTAIRKVLDISSSRAEQRRAGISGLFVSYDCRSRAKNLVKPLPPLPEP